jgi:hypothetical protein
MPPRLGHLGNFAPVPLFQTKHPGRALVVGGLVLVAVGALALFIVSTQSGSPRSNQPSSVVAITPEEGQLLIPQGMIGAQVRSNLTAQLTFDHTPIPQDQIESDPSLGTYNFTPGPGKEFREFPKGRHSITVEYWPRGIADADTAKKQGKLGAFTWTISVG